MTFIDSVMREVPVDRITREAREIHFWRTVLTLVAGLLYGIGWLVAKLFTGFWLALAWTFTAVKLGWQEGRKSNRPQ